MNGYRPHTLKYFNVIFILFFFSLQNFSFFSPFFLRPILEKRQQNFLRIKEGKYVCVFDNPFFSDKAPSIIAACSETKSDKNDLQTFVERGSYWQWLFFSSQRVKAMKLVLKRLLCQQYFSAGNPPLPLFFVCVCVYVFLLHALKNRMKTLNSLKFTDFFFFFLCHYFIV